MIIYNGKYYSLFKLNIIFIMFLFFCISEIAFEMDLGSQQCVDLILNGLKVVEGISFPERKILYNIDIHDAFTIINVTKVLNVYLQFIYPSKGLDTLSNIVRSSEWLYSIA